MKALLTVVAIVALIGSGGYYYVRYVHSEGPANFRTAKVERGEMLPTIGATGTIEPEEVVDIGAQVTGIITDLKADYGTKVEAGQKLAQIDPTKYKAALANADASVARAKANLELAKANVANADAQLRRDETLMSTMPAALVKSQYDIDKAADGVAKAQMGRGRGRHQGGGGDARLGEDRSELHGHQIARQRRDHRPPRQRGPDAGLRAWRVEPVPLGQGPQPRADLGLGQRGRHRPDQGRPEGRRSPSIRFPARRLPAWSRRFGSTPR